MDVWIKVLKLTALVINHPTTAAQLNSKAFSPISRMNLPSLSLTVVPTIKIVSMVLARTEVVNASCGSASGSTDDQRTDALAGFGVATQPCLSRNVDLWVYYGPIRLFRLLSKLDITRLGFTIMSLLVSTMGFQNPLGVRRK